MNSFSFDKYRYDPFIDYLKGVCIIFVILTHTITIYFHEKFLFCLWGDMAVPLFLLVQTFHSLKRNDSPSYLSILEKLLKRVVLPFLVAQLLGVLMLFLFNKGSITVALKKIGNIGPGAYYPYIYLQFTVLLAFCAPIFKKVRKYSIALCIVFISLSILLEFFANYFNLSVGIYRILFIRYFFLIYLGWIWVVWPIKISKLSLLLSLISAGFILFFNYYDNLQSFEPWFYMRGWKIFHWISYIYVSCLLVWLINVAYKHSNKLIANILRLIGKYSYEIFLFQMLYFIVSPMRLLRNAIFSSPPHEISNFIIPIADVLFCTIPILLIKRKYITK